MTFVTGCRGVGVGWGVDVGGAGAGVLVGGAVGLGLGNGDGVGGTVTVGGGVAEGAGTDTNGGTLGSFIGNEGGKTKPRSANPSSKAIMTSAMVATDGGTLPGSRNFIGAYLTTKLSIWLIWAGSEARPVAYMPLAHWCHINYNRLNP